MNKKEIAEIKKELSAALDRAGSSFSEFETEVKRQKSFIDWEIRAPYEIINASLTWRKTKQDHDYWWRIYNHLLKDRRVVVVAAKGTAVPDYEITRIEGGGLQAGCQTLTRKHQKKLFKVLAKELGYEIQE